MSTTYRVHFPGITQDFSRDFTTEAEALAFRNRTRDHAGNMWRHVRLEVINHLTPAEVAERLAPLIAKAETGEQWADICAMEAALLGQVQS